MASLVTGVTHAASIWWQPTGSLVNFFSNTDSGFNLAIFDVANFDGARNIRLDLNPNPTVLLTGSVNIDTINFTVLSGSNFTATSTVTGNTITLFGDDQFVLAISLDNINWFEPISWTEGAADSGIYAITFTNGVSISTNVSPVPVPAALWLFGTGLLGLVAVARRKNIA
jgi:hypothetical protein